MKPIFESQELAKCFNEDEAVWQRFEEKRRSRGQFGLESLLPEGIQDQLDWMESERECRETKCFGSALP